MKSTYGNISFVIHRIAPQRLAFLMLHMFVLTKQAHETARRSHHWKCRPTCRKPL